MELRTNADRSGPTDLTRLFNARSIALVGATEKSAWCHILQAGIRGHAFEGRFHFVNPKGGEIFGQTAFSSCTAIDEPVDLAIFMVPAAVLEEAVTEAGAAGIRFGVVLTSGFSELGAQGAELQARLVSAARRAGMIFLGPNSLGFLNFAENVPAMVMPPQLPKITGHVGVVSQSGATAIAIASHANQQGIGLSQMVALGNEAKVDMADVIDFLIEDAQTKAIAVFIESVRDADRMIAVAARALQAGKPIVVMKVGASPLTAQVAQAHTGALVGDDKVFDAASVQLGMIRVRSVEELVATAGLLAYTGPLRVGSGLGVVSISGGACEMIADYAHEFDVSLPPFAPHALAPLRASLSELGASTHNPLDITGAALTKPEMFEKVLGALSADDEIGIVATVYGLPSHQQTVSKTNAASLAHIAVGMTSNGKPGFLLTQTLQPVDEVGRKALADAGIGFALGGLRDGVRAVGHAQRWSARQAQAPFFRPTNGASLAQARPQSERQTLDYLKSFDVPVIPAQMVNSAEAAVASFKTMKGQAVALKIASADIAHKTEVGGVALHLRDEQAVAKAYNDILNRVRLAAPNARIDGVIVSPMRPQGVELFVGVTRDPQWGLVLAVAMGGIWVELLQDSSLRLLPVGDHEIATMFRGLNSARILEGYRGQPAVDIEAVSRVVGRIANAAVALGPELVSLEINPLYVGPDGTIECLDALAIWQ